MSDASGRTVVLSGATSGIGKAAAHALAAGGARLTLVGRNEALLAELAAELGEATDWVVADLASLEETRRAAAEIRERHDRIDVLINNAGGFFSRRGESAEGLELSLALNHLSRSCSPRSCCRCCVQRPGTTASSARASSTWPRSRTVPACGGTTSPASAATG